MDKVEVTPAPAPTPQVAVTKGKRILVAIPCYNEEPYIAQVVAGAKPYAEEVLVIDDGSSDRTREVAAFAGASVVRNPKNMGKGYGIRRAFQYAYAGDFDAVVLMDGDMQHDPAEIPKLLEPILRDEKAIDVSLGFRHGDTTEMPLWRKFGKRVLDYATAIAGAGIVTDSQCGYRAFGKKGIRSMMRLQGDGFGIESEQLVVGRKDGLEMQNVRISCRYAGLDGSTQHPIRHASGVMWDLLRISLREAPVSRVFLPATVGMVAGGVLAGALLFTRPTPLVAALGWFAAGSLLTAGLLGALLALGIKATARSGASLTTAE